MTPEMMTQLALLFIRETNGKRNKKRMSANVKARRRTRNRMAEASRKANRR